MFEFWGYLLDKFLGGRSWVGKDFVEHEVLCRFEPFGFWF